MQETAVRGRGIARRELENLAGPLDQYSIQDMDRIR
jgi:hypothetical protein